MVDRFNYASWHHWDNTACASFISLHHEVHLKENRLQKRTVQGRRSWNVPMGQRGTRRWEWQLTPVTFQKESGLLAATASDSMLTVFPPTQSARTRGISSP